MICAGRSFADEVRSCFAVDWGDAGEQFQALRVTLAVRERRLQSAHTHLDVAGDGCCAGTFDAKL